MNRMGITIFLCSIVIAGALGGEREESLPLVYHLSPRLSQATKAPCYFEMAENGQIDWKSINGDKEAELCVGVFAVKNGPINTANALKQQGFQVVPSQSGDTHYLTASWMTSERGPLYKTGFLQNIAIRLLSHSQQISIEWRSDREVDVVIGYTYT